MVEWSVWATNISLNKQALHESIGKKDLNWKKLAEVLLDIKVNRNNLPLIYMKDDIQYPVLTPNSMILGRETAVLEENPEDEHESDWNMK